MMKNKNNKFWPFKQKLQLNGTSEKVKGEKKNATRMEAKIVFRLCTLMQKWKSCGSQGGL